MRVLLGGPWSVAAFVFVSGLGGCECLRPPVEESTSSSSSSGAAASGASSGAISLPSSRAPSSAPATSTQGSSSSSRGSSAASSGMASSLPSSSSALPSSSSLEVSSSSVMGSSSSGPSGCRVNSECTMGSDDTCFPPGTVVDCAGSCQDRGSTACTMDNECTGVFDAGMGRAIVCAEPEPIHCPCTSGQQLCTQGCVEPSDCPVEKACVAGECLERACNLDAGAACPPLFACDAQVCRRATCVQDAECGSGGYCVRGMCFPGLGTCGSGGS